MRLEDEYGVVLKCILIIELIWVARYGKWEKNHHYGEILRGGTGTDCVLSTGIDTGTGTQCSILDSVRMLAITCSFIIRFELF